MVASIWPGKAKGSTGTNRDERGLESVESVLEAWDLCQHRYVPVLQPDLGAVLILVCLIVRLGNDMAPKPHPSPRGSLSNGNLINRSQGFLSRRSIVPSQQWALSLNIYLDTAFVPGNPAPPPRTHARLIETMVHRRTFPTCCSSCSPEALHKHPSSNRPLAQQRQVAT